MEYVIFAFIISGILIFLFNMLPLNKKNTINNHKYRYNNPSICILIPARYESGVISGLLDSIKFQTHHINMDDVYIIIEDENDKTNEISAKYGTKTVIRKQLNLQRKGYALDEAIQQIQKSYDMYFIIDADNVLDKYFVEKLVETYNSNYDIGIGYRNTKNGNQNVISSCSSVLFSILNSLNKSDNNIVISGTGFYISGELIRKWHGYPFHSLTEDYELKLYCLLNDINCGYNEDAIYYDEQPINVADSIAQRTRWVKGFFEARKKYLLLLFQSFKYHKNNFFKIKEILVITPYILIIIGILLLIIANIINIIYHALVSHIIDIPSIITIGYIFAFIYLLIQIVTIIFLLNDKKLNLNKSSKIKSIFYNPIFLLSFINCAILAIINKDIKWQKIEHTYQNILK